MTEAEIEMELGALRARLAQLEQGQESRAAQWRKLVSKYRLCSFLFLGSGVAFSLLYFWMPITIPMPMGLAFVMFGMVLGMLVRALQAAPARPR